MPPTTTEGAVGVIVTLVRTGVTTAGVTVTIAVPVTVVVPLTDVAVMVEVQAATPVTSPVLSTVAIVELLEENVVVAPTNAVPFWSIGAAVS